VAATGELPAPVLLSKKRRMADTPVRVRGLCHVALRMRDLRSATAFHRDHFGLRHPDGNLVQVLWLLA